MLRGGFAAHRFRPGPRGVILGEQSLAASLDTVPAPASGSRPPSLPPARRPCDTEAAHPLARDLDVGRRVLRAEIAGLERLAGTLDVAFGRALDLCAAARGRLIVTGIGKSGHVARKIAA